MRHVAGGEPTKLELEPLYRAKRGGGRVVWMFGQPRPHFGEQLLDQLRARLPATQINLDVRRLSSLHDERCPDRKEMCCRNNVGAAYLSRVSLFRDKSDD